MDASEILGRIARSLKRHGLEAILIGNAGAALHGAPVSTVDDETLQVDFMDRLSGVRSFKTLASDQR